MVLFTENHVFLLYRMGSPTSELTEQQETVKIFEHPNILRLGAPNDNVSVQLFKGIIDEIRFYNHPGLLQAKFNS